MRDKTIDLAKGLAIILVMIGHTLTNQHICNAIYSFHMPFFFVLSGYFMKKKSIDNTYILKLYKTLLLPYLVTALITICISFLWYQNFYNDFIATILVGCKIFNIDIPFIGAIWFLVALFISKIIVQVVINGIIKWEFLLLFATISFVISKTIGIVMPWCISIIGFCSIFVFIGYILKRYEIINILYNEERSLLIAVMCLIFAPFVPLAVRINFYPLGLFNIITASLISIAVLLIVKRLLWMKQMHWFMNILSWVGMNSLLVLCIHSIECHFHILDITYNEYYNCFIRILIIIILTFSLSKIAVIKKIFNVK